ncbi:MAG: hypothetical protein ABL895_01140 [Cyclobacteriaceae bacterium]
MIRVILFFLFFGLVATSFAQELPRQLYADSVLGWMKVYKFKGTKEPLKVDTKIYSAAQLSIGDSIANWIQASYVPIGGLGDVKKVVSAERFFYKDYSAALPPNYGVEAHTYYFLKYNSSRKLVPATNHSAIWSIMANEVPSYFIRGLTTNKQQYFTIPGMDEDLLKDPRSQEYKDTKLYNIAKHPVVGKYICMVIPEANGYQQIKAVILSKDNKLPFIHVTIGEVLRVAEEVIPVHWEIEKKKIFEKTQGNQKDIEFYTKSEMEKIEKAKTTLAKLREKYKTRISEPAYLYNTGFELITLANGYDIFAGYQLDEQGPPIKKTNPVYKVDPAIQALCKTDKPQWIYMYWNGTLNDPVEKHMHESIINNFNFDYVYNFFFDPEKVKGQPYKPLRSPLFKEAVIVTEASETSKKNSADKNVYFFEDFSGTAIGKSPANWTCNLVNGEKAVVAETPEAAGNWIVVKGHAIKSSNLKNPFPSNFELSFDVAAPKDFTWGGKRLDVVLAKDNGSAYSFRFSISPGYGGANGEIQVESNFGNDYEGRTKWYKAPNFSNDKILNKAKVVITKKGEALQIFVNDTLIAEYPKAMPANVAFSQLQFLHANSYGETEKYYVSNIKITKQ